MKSKMLALGLVLILTANLHLKAQYAKDDSTFKKCFIGTTAFLLGNFAKSNTPDFAQLNFGYRLTEKDVVSIEFKTWKYAWSLGISPYTNPESYEAPETEFPGYIREVGFALVYQRYVWKGLYAGVHVMNAWQSFVDENNQKIDNGFQIFNTYRVGYHIKLFKDRFFIEPSIAITHRPLHTEMPAAFKQMDDLWPNYLIGEPGLHLGFNF